MKKPQISIDADVHQKLKRYCAIKGKKLSQIGSSVLRAFLETEHDLIESEGEMTIEGEQDKPETIVKILRE